MVRVGLPPKLTVGSASHSRRGEGTLEHDGTVLRREGVRQQVAKPGSSRHRTAEWESSASSSDLLVRTCAFLSGGLISLFIWILKKRGLLKDLGRLRTTGGFSGS